jgi:hypothetical protein
VGVPLLFYVYEREREQLPPQKFMGHTWDYQTRTQFFELLQMIMGIIADGSRE